MSVVKIENAVLTKALEWAYDKAISGIGGFDSADKLAKDQLDKAKSRDGAVEALINWQMAKCATSGFVTGLGGIVTLPLAIPANISSVLLLQLRMILSIAIIGGYNPKEEGVKSLAFLCLTGNVAPYILKEAGFTTERWVTRDAVQKISDAVKKRINYLVKIRLVTKTGRMGLLGFGKILPIVGGVIGGVIDGASTRSIGNAARRLFISPFAEG